jgi:hypothetical protein
MTTIDPRTPESGSPQPVWPPQQVPAPRRKSRLPMLIGGVFALVVVIVATVIATIALSGGSQPTAAPKPASAGALPVDQCGGGLCDAEPTAAPTTDGPAVTAADIKLTPQVTGKQCFGSAGCNVTLKVKLAYDGPALDPDGTWLVTYEIKGGDDGPIIGSFEMMGDRTYEVNTEIVGTRSSKTKVTIKVTNVEKVGV